MDNRELAEQLEKILRLDTMPVAMKFYDDRKDLPREPLNFKLNLCQLVAMARYQGRTNSGVPDMMICAMGAACTGLIKTPDDIKSGQAAVGAYCKDIESGKKFMENTFKLGDSGKVYDAVLVSPLANAKFEPDVVIIYSNPAQVMRLIHGCVYDNGEKVKADTVAEAAMCSCAGYVLAKREPMVGFPCAGDRIFGGTQNFELVFAAPYELVRDKLVENLEMTAKGGFSVYPVPPNMFWTPSMPPAYTITEDKLKG
ncbi:MAG: DUF169 domain-containing protein [Firmicutes bacterium]|nr:DUF169 domain-containing protein [Bacillota bacterium]